LAAPWLSAFVFGVSFLGDITAITDVFRRLLPPGEWGRAMGLSTAAFALGQALGPSLSGLAGELFGGAAGALGLSTLLLALALLVSGAAALRRPS
jgi:MFS family permease